MGGTKSSMLVHTAVTVSSEDRARSVFQDLFGLPEVKISQAGHELCRALFDLDGPVTIMLFRAGDADIEVFVNPETSGPLSRFDHMCLAVPDRPALLTRAEAMGFSVSRFARSGKDIVFLRDLDGNLYEIKEKQ